jgi:hypothetical protein
MHDTLSRRAEELAHLTDLIRTSLSLADSAIGPINEQLAELAEMGIDNIEIEGPAIYSRAAGWSPAFDENRILYAAALIMPGGVGCTAWAVDVGKGDAALFLGFLRRQGANCKKEPCPLLSPLDVRKDAHNQYPRQGSNL